MSDKDAFIDIEQYSLVKLSDVSSILSSAGFIRVFRKGADHSQKILFIHCPELYDPEKMEFVMKEADGFVKGYAILPKTQDINIVYLTSILNSFVSWAFLADGDMEKRTSITLKKLRNISVRLLPDEIQRAVGYLYYILKDIRKQKEAGDTNPYLDYWISVYLEAQNAIALELVMPQFFKEYEITMLETWCALIGKCSSENPGIDLERMKEVLGQELLAPQNQMTGNIKKLRVVMHAITQKINDQK